MSDRATTPRTRQTRRALPNLFLFLALVGLPACGTIGPDTVTRDRFDYTGAVALDRFVNSGWELGS